MYRYVAICICCIFDTAADDAHPAAVQAGGEAARRLGLILVCV